MVSCPWMGGKMLFVRVIGSIILQAALPQRDELLVVICCPLPEMHRVLEMLGLFVEFIF